MCDWKKRKERGKGSEREREREHETEREGERERKRTTVLFAHCTGRPQGGTMLGFMGNGLTWHSVGD